jgi:hypothetical protein
MLKKKEFSLEKACQSASYRLNLQEVIQTHPSESARNPGLSILCLFNDEKEKALEYLEVLAHKNPFRRLNSG